MWGLQGNIAVWLKRFRFDLEKGQSGPPLAVLAWWSFLFALVTGVVLAFHYRPYGDVFTSVSKITHWIPYGNFIRKLHYLSGQCFLILTIAHTLEHFLRKTYSHIQPLSWMRLVILFSLSFPLIFTGFILKGDKEGILAGKIMYYLAGEVPIVGSGLGEILLRPGDDFFLLPYLHHTVILPFLVVFLLGIHRRRLLPRGALGWPLVAFLSLIATFYSLPPDIPPHVEVTHITGPWFFHGIQLLLRYFPPLWAGVVWPLIPVGLLAILSFLPSQFISWARALVIITFLLHLAILLLAWFLFPRLGA